MEWLKKTWKLLVGFAIAILGGMLLFRKNESGKIIEETTSNANESFDKIVKADEDRNRKIEAAEEKLEEEVSAAEEVFEKRKLEIRKESLDIKDQASKDLKDATELLAKELEVLNLDED